MFSCFGKRPCPFCDITTEAGFKIVHESEDMIAFHDRSPGGKLHLLVVPREHIKTIKDIGEGELPLVQKMIGLGKQLLKENGYDPDDKQVRMGFHAPPFNSVNHLHLHVIYSVNNVYRNIKYGFKPWFVKADNFLDF